MAKIYAIIPARSGSKGLKNKNILPLAGKELMGYSIEFANKLGVDRVLCSTDSEQYAEVAKKFGAEVPFLRSKEAAADTAMEQDILRDLYAKFESHRMAQPDILVWLRPTFVFHDLKAVKRCISRLLDDSSLSSCRTVCETEGRIYHGDAEKILMPGFNDQNKSMIRRQEVPAAYKVFSTDVFRSHDRVAGDRFLGDRVGYEVINKICGLDIDDAFDFNLVELLVKHRRDLVNEYL